MNNIWAIITILVAVPGAIWAIVAMVKDHSGKKKQDQHEAVKNEIVSGLSISNNATGSTAIDCEYSNCLVIGGMQFSYIPLIASWEQGENEFRIAEISTNIVNEPYVVPDDFMKNLKRKPAAVQKEIMDNTTESKVRLVNYNIKINPGRISNELLFNFSKIKYRDYLLTNNVLDEKVPYSDITFRERYFKRYAAYNAESGNLSNICGVGVFILTSDNKVILVQTSPNVSVNPNRIAYSASGTMDWNDTKINPFDEVMRECREEINHIIHADNLYLFSFGLDVAKAYYQFTFFEKTAKTADAIISNARMARDFAAEVADIFAIDFNYKNIVKSISEHSWDATTAATLITLCAKYFGKEKIEHYINPANVYSNYQNEMQAEWDIRANREGKGAVLSNRFPIREIDRISDDYLNGVMTFIGNDINGKVVMEIGCGIGLMTRELYKKANSLICIDISSKMIERNKELLGQVSDDIHYFNCFFQDYPSKQKVDVIISSLVMIHNTNSIAIEKMTAKMQELSDTIFLFEQVDTGIQVSGSTKAREEKDYLGYFKGYKVAKRKEHYLFTDKIVFLKLVRA